VSEFIKIVLAIALCALVAWTMVTTVFLMNEKVNAEILAKKEAQ